MKMFLMSRRRIRKIENIDDRTGHIIRHEGISKPIIKRCIEEQSHRERPMLYRIILVTNFKLKFL